MKKHMFKTPLSLIICIIGVSVWAQEDNEPKELTALRKVRDSAIEKANKDYAGGLEKLKKSLEMKKDVKGVEVVQNEMKELIENNSDKGLNILADKVNPEKDIIGKWKHQSNGNIWEFNEKKKGILKNQGVIYDLIWKISGGKIIVTYKATGNVDTFLFESNDKNLILVTSPNGIKFTVNRETN